MRKFYKVSKYLIVTGFVVLISSLTGQKHSSNYTFAIPEVNADVPAPTDGTTYDGGDGACGASDGTDGGASSSDDGGVDGASADGAGDGACAA